MNLTSKNYAKEILDDINEETCFIISTKREKNARFTAKYGLSHKDIEEYILSLTVDDFIEKIENKDSKIKTDYLYVFKIMTELTDEYGATLESIYIKLCKLNGVKEKILIVSFHDINNF